MLLLENSRVKRTAAMCLEVIASNEAYTQKVISLLDLSTDGAKTSDALLKRAAILRKQDAEDLVLENSALDAGFEIAEWPLGNSSFETWQSRQYWSGE